MTAHAPTINSSSGGSAPIKKGLLGFLSKKNVASTNTTASLPSSIPTATTVAPDHDSFDVNACVLSFPPNTQEFAQNIEAVIPAETVSESKLSAPVPSEEMIEEIDSTASTPAESVIPVNTSTESVRIPETIETNPITECSTVTTEIITNNVLRDITQDIVEDEDDNSISADQYQIDDR